MRVIHEYPAAAVHVLHENLALTPAELGVVPGHAQVIIKSKIGIILTGGAADDHFILLEGVFPALALMDAADGHGRGRTPAG